MPKVPNKSGNAGKSERARQEQFPVELKHISALIPSIFQITLEKKFRGAKNKSLAGEKGKKWVAHSTRTEKPKDIQPGRDGAPLQKWVQPLCMRIGVTSRTAERIKDRMQQEFKLQPNNPLHSYWYKRLLLKIIPFLGKNNLGGAGNIQKWLSVF